MSMVFELVSFSSTVAKPVCDFVRRERLLESVTWSWFCALGRRSAGPPPPRPAGCPTGGRPYATPGEPRRRRHPRDRPPPAALRRTPDQHRLCLDRGVRGRGHVSPSPLHRPRGRLAGRAAAAPGPAGRPRRPAHGRAVPDRLPVRPVEMPYDEWCAHWQGPHTQVAIGTKQPSATSRTASSRRSLTTPRTSTRSRRSSSRARRCGKSTPSTEAAATRPSSTADSRP